MLETPLRVALVDDSATVRQLLSCLFATDDRFEVVQEHEDAASALLGLASGCSDVVVLDNSMPPGEDGVSALPALRRACPLSRIVVYSSDAHVREQALVRGADAFVDKAAPLDLLLTTAVGD